MKLLFYLLIASIGATIFSGCQRSQYSAQSEYDDMYYSSRDRQQARQQAQTNITNNYYSGSTNNTYNDANARTANPDYNGEQQQDQEYSENGFDGNQSGFGGNTMNNYNYYDPYFNRHTSAFLGAPNIIVVNPWMMYNPWYRPGFSMGFGMGGFGMMGMGYGMGFGMGYGMMGMGGFGMGMYDPFWGMYSPWGMGFGGMGMYGMGWNYPYFMNYPMYYGGYNNYYGSNLTSSRTITGIPRQNRSSYVNDGTRVNNQNNTPERRRTGVDDSNTRRTPEYSDRNGGSRSGGAGAARPGTREYDYNSNQGRTGTTRPQNNAGPNNTRTAPDNRGGVRQPSSSPQRNVAPGTQRNATPAPQRNVAPAPQRNVAPAAPRSSSPTQVSPPARSSTPSYSAPSRSSGGGGSNSNSKPPSRR
jgi:hypothetical protein